MKTVPEALKSALSRIVIENHMEYVSNTHYDAVNAEIFLYSGNLRRRLNCEIVGSGVQIFIYIDVFPFCPRFLKWCHNNIPMFPLLAKIEWKKVADLPVDETEDYYYLKISEFLAILMGPTLQRPSGGTS